MLKIKKIPSISEKILILLILLITMSFVAIKASASEWVNTSGNTTQTGDILELVSDFTTTARAEIVLDVVPGNTYIPVIIQNAGFDVF